MTFGRRIHPIGTAARMAADTMKATRGRGIPAETIASWPKRGSDPSAHHLWILRQTYGWSFIEEVFVEVDDAEVVAAERDLAAAQARLSALKTRGLR